MKKNLKQQGFSLLEVMVSVALFILVILFVTEMFSFIMKAYRTGSDKAEVSQNARVALDRISREMRQSVVFVGTIPSSYATATTSIEFQDGHDQSTIMYTKYYATSSNLMRDTKYYYFASNPSTKVRWDDLGTGGVKPVSTTTTSNIVGEYFTGVKFYGTSTSVTIEVDIKKNLNRFKLETTIFTRN